jgi:hypothetical protein
MATAPIPQLHNETSTLRSLWVTAYSGLVIVGSGNLIGNFELLRWQDPDHHELRYVGVMTNEDAGVVDWNVCVPSWLEAAASRGSSFICAVEDQTCACPGGQVRYGANRTWSEWLDTTHSIECVHSSFGVQLPDASMQCQCHTAAPVLQPMNDLGDGVEFGVSLCFNEWSRYGEPGITMKYNGATVWDGVFTV